MLFLSQIELMAKQEGIEQNARDSILEVLQVRFDAVPEELILSLNVISDISRLKQLLRSAITINSLADFQQLLE